MENMDLPEQSGPSSLIGPAARAPDADGSFATTVNGVVVKFAKPEPTGGRVLEKAGFDPFNDHVLILFTRRGSRSIGLDETVNLALAGTEVFRAFKSDRIFRFTLNGYGFEWGVAKVLVQELRDSGHVGRDEIVVLERDGDEIELPHDGVINLAPGGTENLHTEKRLITVYFENDPREIPRGKYSTEQLVSLFGVQAGYILEYLNNEGQLMPLGPDGELRVKDGMKFFEQVPCGGSS
ncbi:multiubiquitin domain-containing protein [Mesorhizobium sp. f-mel]